MLFSEKKERARRFGLALRMGIPILLLIGVVLFYFFWNNKFVIRDIDIVIFAVIIVISVYFLFFLINLGQAETFIDRMTGTFNRHSLLAEIRRHMRNQKKICLILLRIENLSYINDYYGIDRGDRLLRIYIHLLDEFMKLHDVKEPIVGRYHGGDFIVAVPLEKGAALSLMDEFVQTYKEVGGIEIETRISAQELESGEEVEPLINHLYDTLYQRKKASGESREKRLDIARVEEEITDAIRRGRLILYYVPTLHVTTGMIDLFEVGVRLETEHNGILPPKKFIPVVNRLGLEKEYDEALFKSVCRDAKEVDEAVRFSFNVSPHSLRNEAFVDMIKEIAAHEGVAYRRIILELFENRAVKDIKRYRVVLEDLKELGVRFALDNFGGTNASFDYIKRLPVDMVQFDREFTLAYNNPRIEALLKGYLQACKSMGIETLVKWVDTDEALARFRALGVDYIQGFIVADRPLDRSQLIKQYGVKQ